MIGELHVVLLPGTNMAWLHARSSGTISSSRCQITRTSKQPIGPFDMCEFIFCGRAIQARSAISSLAFQPRPSRSIKSGGARRDRTDDLLLAKQALSQLSYGPATQRYASKGGKWWAWEDLNFRPHAYQARALTN